ncbi:hypothetical protein AKJ35_01430 [candidate division MSBL1 archaeon SCGC-AAA833F18]|uniref:Uncharacterized protein n=1 Tax=candidate division MSBL1 archaeon SCGC-AAA833F18 TaxID=1698257 RepID=A0A133VRK3_9EURY|nr:hypothetical protein AKJ35_01430 [candidate division MSBL1 archaeon SCGC-AAA833F18]
MGEKKEEFLRVKNEGTQLVYRRAFDLLREYGRVELAYVEFSPNKDTRSYFVGNLKTNTFDPRS